MPQLLSGRCIYRCSAMLSTGVFFALLLAHSSASASDVSTLFQQARTTANQLNRDAAIMESYARTRVTWQSHGHQIDRIKEHINTAGSILSQLHSAREDAQPWHQDAIDGITPMLKQLAANTESIINRLNETPKMLRDPKYIEYLDSNAQLAKALAAAIRNVVAYDETKTKMEELETKLGQK